MLESAGLISRTRKATARLSHLEADPLREATEWLVGYREYWEESHERLDALLAALQVDQHGKEPMMAKTQIDAPAGVPFIDITREFDAPRDLVFQAYTEPELLVQWLGPRKYTMTSTSGTSATAARGATSTSDDDGNAWGFHGVFHGDQTPDGMLQTFEFEGAPGHVSLEKLVLEERDGKTIVRNHAVYQSIEARDAMVESGMEEGMNDGFDRLDELLATARASRWPDDGLQARARPDPGRRRRPGQGLLQREGRLRRRCRPPAERGVPDRPADAARLRLLDHGRQGGHQDGPGLRPGPAARRRGHRGRARRARRARPRHQPDPPFRGRRWIDGKGGRWNSFAFFDDPDGNGWALQERG